MERAFTHQLPLGWRCCFMRCSMERASHIELYLFVAVVVQVGTHGPSIIVQARRCLFMRGLLCFAQLLHGVLEFGQRFHG